LIDSGRGLLKEVRKVEDIGYFLVAHAIHSIFGIAALDFHRAHGVVRDQLKAVPNFSKD
jgi:hypothetical protein